MPGRRFVLIAVFLFTTVASAEDAPQTGSFTATFTQRSPQSMLKTLGQRFGIDKPGPDYDLSAEKFLVHVPPNYDPAKPMGLIVMLIYKEEKDQLNADDLKVLDERNLAIITRAHGAGELLSRGGCALDAAHNMQQRYAIDPTRLYLFSFITVENVKDVTGLRLFTSFPEVFSGAMLNGYNQMWVPIKTANNKMYDISIKPPPPPQQRTLAGKHPLVIAYESSEADYIKLLSKAWMGQGFRSTKTIEVTRDDTHYPNFTTGWLTETIEYLDAHKVVPPATKPATH